LIEPFQLKDWNALWQLRSHQLAEEGIIISDKIPSQPDLNSPYEKDYHRLDQVYQRGRGNFWIAWLGDDPAGHIGAEDKESYIELRRMYVREEYRHRGIGTKLVQALIKHCYEQKVSIIELWTARGGPGSFLYREIGFREVENVSNENHEIRMRLILEDQISAAQPRVEHDPPVAEGEGSVLS